MFNFGFSTSANAKKKKTAKVKPTRKIKLSTTSEKKKAANKKMLAKLPKPKVIVEVKKNKSPQQVVKVQVKTPKKPLSKPVVKTMVTSQADSLAKLSISKPVITKLPRPISVPKRPAAQGQGQSKIKVKKGYVKLPTIKVKGSNVTSYSPSKQVKEIKKVVKQLKSKDPVLLDASKLSKLASTSSKLSNNAQKVVAQSAVLPEVSKDEVKLSAITDVINSNDTPDETSKEILEKLNDIQGNIIKQQNAAFRGNVLKKLSSIDNKVRLSTLAYRGAVGHIRDSL